MDIRDLRYFQLVARSGHIGKAAQGAHRSQPAISKSIQRIEHELGVTLFDRSRRKLELTTVGRLLQDRCETLLRDMDELQREVRAAALGEVGHVRVGVSGMAADILLSQLTSSLLAQHPGITLEVEVGMNDSLAQALSAHALDIVVAPATHAIAGLDFEAVLPDQVVVVADKAHPLVGKRTLKLPQLRPYKWVLPSRSSESRRWLETRFAEQREPKPVAQIQSNSISLTPRMISGTHLLTHVSRRNLAMEPLASIVREIDVPALTMPRDFGILVREGASLSPAAEAVRSQVRAACAQTLGAKPVAGPVPTPVRRRRSS
ncbi:LysR family transcriptional regulator [Hydrogenophaga sp. BPS33]|uniref:LysR family transcriptional regulator n=1 Tax=Hydrogenophaga sp. BPS33 TaxID=2651974 RepID=UPI00131F7B12|nr:LysR family transcriptional regulator [Hydrogenophaga sp. BPS33]QHE85030.1 LysR family transcriptional regulator [Hydrogenophaga sp. BPS33]